MSQPRFRLIVSKLSAALAGLVCAAIPAAAERIALAGPVEAEVLRVIDGDTVEARALVWPGHSVTVSVRIRGIDAPEVHSRCGREREAAARARDRLAELVADGHVRLTNIGGGKYYGRVLADLATAREPDLGAALLDAALVRPYGGGRRTAFCGENR